MSCAVQRLPPPPCPPPPCATRDFQLRDCYNHAHRAPVIAAAKKKHIRFRHHHSAVIVSVSAHEPHTSRQNRQHRDGQPHLDQLGRAVTSSCGVSGTEEIKCCALLLDYHARQNSRACLFIAIRYNPTQRFGDAARTIPAQPGLTGLFQVNIVIKSTNQTGLTG